MKIEMTYAYVNLHFGSIKEMYNLKFMTRARSTESQRLKISTKKANLETKISHSHYFSL